jgi:hypothetical protein
MSIRTMFKSKTAVAKDIIKGLISIVVGLRADDRFSAASPQITSYLRDKATPDLVNAIEGCNSLLAQMKGPMPPMNPEIIVNCREALTSEVQRRRTLH